jgi:acetyl-CoA carboxylase biotin carboxyl carrier protein
LPLAPAIIAQVFNHNRGAVRMNIKEVKDLIHEVLQSDISEFELEHTGTKIRLRRGATNDPVVQTAPSRPAASVPSQPRLETASALAAAVEDSSDEGLHIITSPIVGTFYRAPSPGAEPFVKIGQSVEAGSTLCIVEAMKLMNEIPSDVSGEVMRIYVENNQPVEYGQKLFGIQSRK